jgi:predicted transcriptional regulator
MNRNGRQPDRHLIDGREMTVQEIADMLGVTKLALQGRRSRLGRPSYQTVVNMYRENCFGHYHDRSARYMVDGQWMTRKQIAEMLDISLSTLANWLCDNKGKSIADAVAWYRLYQTGERKRHHGQGGRKPKLYRVGSKTYSVPQVARMFGVTNSSVTFVLKHRNGDMAATIRHYKDRETRRTQKAEKDIMSILGF